jgi:hypothetical protein
MTGIYDYTILVDNNVFEDARLLQTGLSLSDTFFNIVEDLPYPYDDIANVSTKLSALIFDITYNFDNKLHCPFYQFDS